jgi:hypothetical protein
MMNAALFTKRRVWTSVLGIPIAGGVTFLAARSKQPGMESGIAVAAGTKSGSILELAVFVTSAALCIDMCACQGE